MKIYAEKERIEAIQARATETEAHAAMSAITVKIVNSVAKTNMMENYTKQDAHTTKRRQHTSTRHKRRRE